MMSRHAGTMETLTPAHVPLDGPLSRGDLARSMPARAQEWADAFVLSRENVGAAERGRFYRRIKTGELAVVLPGICLPAESWRRFDADERYLALLRAAALVARTPVVFAAESAGALWRLPVVGSWPSKPIVLAERAPGGRSNRAVVRRCEGVPDELWAVDGLAVTGLARTVVDVSRFSSFGVAVPMADRALAPKATNLSGALAAVVTKGELVDAMVELHVVHGAAKARLVIDFADGMSGSAGESISRVVIHRLGFPPPVLQHVFRDAVGRMIVDFWWPQHSLIGEFDGRGKYLRDEYVRGRSVADVVIAEKERENRLRAQGPSVVRWGWEDAMSPPQLRRRLLAAGLPSTR
jgi:hypothetical protein